jgi:glycosyltransferase involved in cell wall biosynthesis
MVMIESLASGTPLIGLSSGAIPEIITKRNGVIVHQDADEDKTVQQLSKAMTTIANIERSACRTDFEERFTIQRMCAEHIKVYTQLTTK